MIMFFGDFYQFDAPMICSNRSKTIDGHQSLCECPFYQISIEKFNYE